MTINGTEYTPIRLLGKGKGGYSYLVTNGQSEFVIKQIHHEPCAYYQFGNKLESEQRDYALLKDIGIPMPALLAVDTENERLLKEYICGDTAYDLVLRGQLPEAYLRQMEQMSQRLYKAEKNIDFFPTNFVAQDELLYYVDYECNDYMEEWSFECWGRQYWFQSEAFWEYVREHTK